MCTFDAGMSFLTLLQLENGLELLGLLIIQNALKPETAPTVVQLQVA
jgi:magnesium-transporting ATPase (P-type)